MAIGDIETYPEGETWFNRVIGEVLGPDRGHRTKAEAVAAGQALARCLQVDHIVTSGSTDPIAHHDTRTVVPDPFS